MSFALKAYNKMNRLPLGNHLYTRLLTLRAPYFASIRPVVNELRPGCCVTGMKDRRRVRNHINTVHAVAMCNLAELTVGLAVEVSLQAQLRWIPKEMTVQYVKKAKGLLTGSCRFKTEILSPGDVAIPFEITDAGGEVVFRAVITFYISSRPAKQAA